MKDHCFKVWGNLWDQENNVRDEFSLFVRGIDDNHAVMIAKDCLRRNGPCRDGKLTGAIIIEGVEKRAA